MKGQKGVFFLFLVVLSLLMHLPHMNKDLVSIHVWRQAQTQSTIQNFYEEDMNILNPRRNNRGEGEGIFRMEFPLMQWGIALVYKMLGGSILLTRICMFGIGLMSLLGMYHMLYQAFPSEKLALMGSWALAFSPSFYYYMINPLPDNLALCLGIWGLAAFASWVHQPSPLRLVLAGILLSLSTLCKLPFVLYFAFPLGYYLYAWIKNGWQSAFVKDALLLNLPLLLPAAWYLWVIPGWTGNGIVAGVLDNQIGWGIFWEYIQHNLISTLPELLLNYGSVLFFLAGFYFIGKRKSYQHPLFPAFALCGIALIAFVLFEINMIAKIHDYYLFPFLPLLFSLVAFGAWQLSLHRVNWVRYVVYGILLILPLTCYLRMQSRWDTTSPGFNPDILTYKADLQQASPKDALCVVGNDPSHFILFYHLDRKGWGFARDILNGVQLAGMIESGAEYLYSDSREIEQKPDVAPLLDSLVLERGSVRVYTLDLPD